MRMKTAVFALFLMALLLLEGQLGGQTATATFSEIPLLGTSGKPYGDVYRLRVSENGTLVADAQGVAQREFVVPKKAGSTSADFTTKFYFGVLEIDTSGKKLVGNFFANNDRILLSSFANVSQDGKPAQVVTFSTQISFGGEEVLLAANMANMPVNTQGLKFYPGFFSGADGQLYTPATTGQNTDGIFQQVWDDAIFAGVKTKLGDFKLIFLTYSKPTDTRYEYLSVWKLANGDFLAERRAPVVTSSEVVRLSATGTLKQIITSPASLGFTPTQCCKLVVDLPRQAALIGLRDAQSQPQVVFYGQTGTKNVAKAGLPIMSAVIPVDLKGDWALLLGASVGSVGSVYDTLIRINLVTGEQVVVVSRGTQILGQSVISINPELAGIAGNGDVYVAIGSKLAKANIVVIPPPIAPTIISKFEVAPSSVQSGQPATISWSVTGPITEVSLDQGIGVVASTGSRQVAPKATTTYILVAKGPGGSLSKQIVLIVIPPAPSGPIISSIIHGATRQAEPLAPGMIIGIDGLNFGPDTSVLLDGQPLPVDFISPGRISASLLDSTDASIADHSITVVSGGVASTAMVIKIVPQNFAAFISLDIVPGQQITMLTDENGNLLGDPSLNSPNLTQAHAGGQVIVLGTGGGRAVDENGQLYPDEVPDALGPYLLVNMPLVQIDGTDVTPVSAGRVPGTRSKDQIVVQLPADISAGEHTLQIGEVFYSFWVL